MKEEIKIPKSLEPENIMSTIEEREEKKRAQRRRDSKRRLLTLTGTAAAIICILTVIRLYIGQELEIRNMGIYTEIDNEQIKLESIACLSSYDRLYQEKKREEFEAAWKSMFPRFSKKNEKKGFAGLDDLFEPMGSANKNDASGTRNKGEQDNSKKEGSYSQTNVQTEGIDEADIVKTDGEYIYFINTEGEEFMSNLHVKIYRADGENTELVTNLKLVDAVNARENTQYINIGLETDGVYLYKDTLIFMALLSTKNYRSVSALVFLDVSDKARPVVSDIITYEEKVIDSRLYGDILYICGYMPVNAATREGITAQIGGKIIPENHVYMSAEKNSSYNYYTVVGAFDLSEHNRLVDSAAWLGDSAAKIYMSENNLYFYDSVMWSNKNTTIVRIELDKGKLNLCASANIDGYIYNQLALDEYNSYLRVVTTGDTNSLYILNKELKIAGKLENIAPDETVRSVRYMGDICYFVTFRQTDPLFSVDLSEPDNPRIIGELKIPGFSSYLHFMNENTMIGIGEHDEDEDGITQGIKISTFDISDPSDVRETGKWVYKTGKLNYRFNHKAVLAVPDKNLYGFGLKLDEELFYSDTYTSAEKYVYVIMSYIDGKMKEVERIELPNTKDSYNQYEARGVYIGEYLYIVYNNGMEVYPLSGILQESKTECIKRLDEQK